MSTTRIYQGKLYGHIEDSFFKEGSLSEVSVRGNRTWAVFLRSSTYRETLEAFMQEICLTPKDWFSFVQSTHWRGCRIMWWRWSPYNQRALNWCEQPYSEKWGSARKRRRDAAQGPSENAQVNQYSASLNWTRPKQESLIAGYTCTWQHIWLGLLQLSFLPSLS